jgi:hypothetical protein
MTTLRLDEIAQGWDAFETAIEGNAGELTPELEAQLDVLNLAEREKLDGYALYLRSLEEQVRSFKAIEDELAAKRRTVQNRIAWLKGRVEGFMYTTDRDELKGDIYRFKLARNGGKPPLRLCSEDPEAYPVDCRVTTVVLNKEQIRLGIERGTILPELAFIDEPGRSLRIY